MSAISVFKTYLEPLRSALSGGVGGLKRLLKLGDYWYWIDGKSLSKGIDIQSMVYPYRYDILLRKQFFDMYREQHQLYQQDAQLLVRDARASGYFIWFKEVLSQRYRHDLLLDEEALYAAFDQRVLASAKIYDSIIADGFDTTQPIIPYTAENIIPIGNKKVASNQYFMGDGCHRLACLLSMGYTELPTNYLRVKCFRAYQPFDNTSLLAPFFSEAAAWQSDASAGSANSEDSETKHASHNEAYSD